MLRVKLYENSSELYSLEDYVDLHKESNPVFVVPAPAIADDIRKHLQGLSSLSFDVKTISNFRKEQLKELSNSSQEKSKADLLLILSVAWEKFFSEDTLFNTDSYETFIRAFNLFTDLRSFSLDQSLVATVLEGFDPILNRAITVFWTVCDNMSLLDEHKIYSLLSEAYRSNDGPHSEIKDQSYIFFGFPQMSAGQVDLLKSLSIRNDVIVPYLGKAYRQKSDTDWISWLAGAEVSPVVNDQKIENSNIDDCTRKKIRIYEFTRNNLAQALKSVFVAKKMKTKLKFLVGSKKAGFNEFAEIPFTGMSFKIDADLFSIASQALFQQLEYKLLTAKKQKLALSSVNEVLQQLATEALAVNDFIALKTITLLGRVIEDWNDISSEDKELTAFKLKVLQHIHRLNLPRTFSIPLFQQESDILGEISSVSSLVTFSDDNVHPVLCVTSDHGPIVGRDARYSEKVLNQLVAIGPVPRSELDFLFISQKISEIIEREQTTIFLEKDLLKHNLHWSEIFREYDKEIVYTATANEILVKENALDEKMSVAKSKLPYSATKLQSYLDCPQQFYYRYLEKVFPFVRLNNALQPNDLGVLQHKVIEDYFGAKGEAREYDLALHNKVVDLSLKSLLVEKSVSISQKDYQKYQIEIYDYSQNGILKLLSLYHLDPNLSFEFEKEIIVADGKRVGSIDCYVVGSFGQMLIDFKRSKYSIPSKKELLSYQKLQLWFYARSLKLDFADLYCWGYLNLSDPVESLFYAIDECARDELIEKSDLGNKRIISVDKISLKERMEEYEVFEDELLSKLNADLHFDPKPRKIDVCGFCDIKNICSRMARE